MTAAIGTLSRLAHSATAVFLTYVYKSMLLMLNGNVNDMLIRSVSLSLHYIECMLCNYSLNIRYYLQKTLLQVYDVT